MAEKDAFSITEFCQSHGFSRAYFYELVKLGLGPDFMFVGKRRLISREAAFKWRRERERDAKKKVA